MSEPTIDEVIALMEQFAAAGKPVLAYGIEREQMNEPTIRELTDGNLPADSRIWGYTLDELKTLILATKEVERNAVRAFVERVRGKMGGSPDSGWYADPVYYKQFYYLIDTELAAMEAEVKE